MTIFQFLPMLNFVESLVPVDPLGPKLLGQMGPTSHMHTFRLWPLDMQNFTGFGPGVPPVGLPQNRSEK